MRALYAIVALAFAAVYAAACSPSERAIQTAIAETEEARPTETPVPTDTPQPTQTPVPTPTPIPTPSEVPCRIQSQQFLADAEQLMQRWEDADELAGSTARIALAGPIASLQEISREVNNLEVPNCARSTRDLLLLYMDRTIDSYLSFAADEPDDSVQMQILVSELTKEVYLAHSAALSAGSQVSPRLLHYIATGTAVLTKVYYRDETGEIIQGAPGLPWVKTIALDNGMAPWIKIETNRDRNYVLTCAIFLNGQQIASNTDVVGTAPKSTLREVVCEANLN